MVYADSIRVAAAIYKYKISTESSSYYHTFSHQIWHAFIILIAHTPYRV